MILTNLLNLSDTLDSPGKITSDLQGLDTEITQATEFKDLLSQDAVLLESLPVEVEDPGLPLVDTGELQFLLPHGNQLPPTTIQINMPTGPASLLEGGDGNDSPQALLVNGLLDEGKQAGRSIRSTGNTAQAALGQIADSAVAEDLLDSQFTEISTRPQLETVGHKLEIEKALPDLLKQDNSRLESIKDGTGQLQLNSASRPEATETSRSIANAARLSINTPVQSQAWAENFTGRISWMLSNNQQSAQIHLNPAELGPIEVKIQIQNDQANVNFVANNQTTREAIMEAFPRLREMLDQQGFSLNQGSVSDNSTDGQQWDGDSADSGMTQVHGNDMEEHGSSPQEPVIIQGLGLVDHFV